MLIAGIIITIIGLLVTALGVGDRLRARVVRKTPTTRIADAAGGRVEIQGVVVGPVSESLRVPLNTDELVYYDLIVSEERRDQEGNLKMDLLARHTAGVPFLVDDGSGKLARIVPEGATINLEPAKVDRSEKITTGIDAFVLKHGNGEMSKGGRIHTVLKRLMAGDRVYALGHGEHQGSPAALATYRDGTAARLHLEHKPDRELLLSDMSEPALITSLSTVYRVGVVVLLVGLGLSAWGWFR